MFVPKSDWLVSQYNRPRLFLNLVGLYSQNETEYGNGKSPDDDASYSNTIRAAMMASPDGDLTRGASVVSLRLASWVLPYLVVEVVGAP